MINVVCNECPNYGLVAKEFPEKSRKGYPDNPKVNYPYCTDFAVELPFTFEGPVMTKDTVLSCAGKAHRCKKELNRSNT